MGITVLSQGVNVMPQPEINQLSGDSLEPQAKAALSACIANEVRAGKTQEEATAMCYSMIKEQTGKEMLPQGGQ